MAQQASTDDEKKKDNASEYVTSFPNNPLIDRAYGVCIGAAIGDSMGSYLEFRKADIEEEEMAICMTMPGGGVWGNKVITGQVTDDTELAVSLAYGLVDCIGKLSETTRLKSETDDEKQKDKKQYPFMLDLTKITPEYRRWIDSKPFDIGFCTRQTLSVSPDVKKMKQGAIEYNQQKTKSNRSKLKSSIFKGNMANGAMMRCMPLCLYGYQLETNNLYDLMKEDASLTHAHYCVYIVNTCYAIMIQHLLIAKQNDNKRNIDAFNKMIKYLNETMEVKKPGRVGTMRLSDKEKEEKQLKQEAAKEILEGWLENIDESIVKMNYKPTDDELQLHPATIHQGYVKIAFQRCCYHLLNGTGFSEAMKSVINEGGDTDTNACIVGGLMGAYHGLSGIPKQYIINIHECEPKYDENRDIFQAKWYFKDQIPQLLIENAPTDGDINILVYY